MSFLDRFNRKNPDDSLPGKADDPSPLPRPPAGDLGRLMPGAPLGGNAASATAESHEILLDLGDFLPHIPSGLVRAGTFPAEQKLKFDMADLANRIGQGRTNLKLVEIYRQIPGIFVGETAPSGDIEIRFPWEKVMRLLADARPAEAALPKASSLSAAASEAPGNRRAARNISPGMSEAAGVPHPTAPVLPPQPPVVPALLHDEKLSREELFRACDTMKAELERTQAESGRRLAELAAERDAALRQQAELSRELAAQQEHGTRRDAPAQGSHAGLERSPKEHQRQVDELQRRIATIEAHQREAAHELSREKESRIKLERQHGSLDRLNREASKHHEETVAALKRDFETAHRKRDAEAARALKEAQEQFEAVNAAKNRLAVELEAARARLAQTPAVPEEWAARASAQFEADLENYRNRIKELLAERDALTGEKAMAAATRQAAGVADDEALRAERTKLSFELDAARKSSNATITNLRSENKKLTYERDLALKDGEALRVEYEPQAAAWTAERAALARDLAAAREAREAEAAALGELRAAWEKLQTERAAQDSALAEMQAERDGLGAQLQALQAELRRVRQQQEITEADLRASVAERQRDRDAQSAGSAAARQEQKQALAVLAGERDAALAALARERDQARAGADEAREKLSAELPRLTGALDAARQESARAAQALAAANAEADRKFAAAREEREALLASRRILTAELDSAKEALAAAGRLREERDRLLAECADLRERVQNFPAGRSAADGETFSGARDRNVTAPDAAPEVVPPAPPPAIIEVHAPEILPAPAEESGPLKIPRIRPVPVAPPQLHTH